MALNVIHMAKKILSMSTALSLTSFFCDIICARKVVFCVLPYIISIFTYLFLSNRVVFPRLSLLL